MNKHVYKVLHTFNCIFILKTEINMEVYFTYISEALEGFFRDIGLKLKGIRDICGKYLK